MRDRTGIAHIYARNTRDLFFAQGYNAARDRLWQLDLWRRHGEGKMAEQFGPRFAAQDRAARMFLYRGDIDTEFASYHPEGKQILQAFADGINAYVEQVNADPSRLPLEFQLTGARPGRWRPESSLIRIHAITRNVGAEVRLARLVAAIGLEEAGALSVFEPPLKLTAPAGVDLARIPSDVLAQYTLARTGLRFVAADFPRSPLAMSQREALANRLSAPSGAEDGTDPLMPRFESNNWTISGTRTASGKPLLANDPHRNLTLPSLRYMVHLKAPGWNVIGAGEPALPGVSIGHNDRVAFGLTIFAFGDEEDLYVYDTRPDNPDEYRYRDGWVAMTRITETIAVRGQPDRKEVIKFTRHGPVVYEDRPRNKAYAIRAAYLEFPGTAAYLASLRLNQARDWADFVAGMNKHFMPGENMVYADVDGNIGWFGGALAPRRPRDDWSGLLPVPGNGDFEWNGLIQGDDLPRVLNPPEGYFATANAYYLPQDFPYTAKSARTWASPFRKQRIDAVLSEDKRFTREDMQRLQYDDLSIPALRMLALARRLRVADAPTADGLRQLLNWDGVMRSDSPAATICEFWIAETAQRVTAITVSAKAKPHLARLSLRQVLDRLEKPDATFGPDPVAGRDRLLTDALTAGLTALRARERDSANWDWGKLHHVELEHGLAGWFPEETRRQFATPRLAVGGNGDTVHAAEYRRSDFRQTAGASFRQIIDLSDWDRSLVQNAPGQSADPESPFYQNLLKPWADAEYAPMTFTDAAVRRAKHDTLVLKPDLKR